MAFYYDHHDDWWFEEPPDPMPEYDGKWDILTEISFDEECDLSSGDNYYEEEFISQLTVEDSELLENVWEITLREDDVELGQIIKIIAEKAFLLGIQHSQTGKVRDLA